VPEMKRTTVTVPKQLWKEFKKRCVDLDLEDFEGWTQAAEYWLKTTEASVKTPDSPVARRVGGKS